MSKKTTRVRNFRPNEQDERTPCVQVVSGARQGERVVLEPGRTRIGREGSLELCLDEDGVSRRHGEIHVDEHGLVSIVDLDSTNGTFVNGARAARMPLREGDSIQIGSQIELRFGYRTRDELVSKPAVPEAASQAGAVKPSPLTARETEVAQLLAEGHSNDGVAAHLGISSRTVGKHASNIYRKLQIHTRAELTRWILLQR
jgi:DNA-binding CsgD family transcriptional regulator